MIISNWPAFIKNIPSSAGATTTLLLWWRLVSQKWAQIQHKFLLTLKVDWHFYTQAIFGLENWSTSARNVIDMMAIDMAILLRSSPNPFARSAWKPLSMQA
jgi:hypothetical protein